MMMRTESACIWVETDGVAEFVELNIGEFAQKAITNGWVRIF